MNAFVYPDNLREFEDAQKVATLAALLGEYGHSWSRPGTVDNWRNLRVGWRLSCHEEITESQPCDRRAAMEIILIEIQVLCNGERGQHDWYGMRIRNPLLDV